MSTENIYLSVVRWLDGGGSRTDIMKFSYDEGKITGKAAGSVNGYVNSSFSMNEWNGYLRMVVEQYNDTYSNALYILDETMEICEALQTLPGRNPAVVRLLEDTGYFVTYKNVDPLFSVDLSDPENPRILGELKVTGSPRTCIFTEKTGFWESAVRRIRIQGPQRESSFHVRYFRSGKCDGNREICDRRHLFLYGPLQLQSRAGRPGEKPHRFFGG